MEQSEKDYAASIGIKKGNELLASAVETAKTSQELANHIYACRWAAITIIAQEMYNLKTQNKCDYDEYLRVLNHNLGGMLASVELSSEKGDSVDFKPGEKTGLIY